MAGISACSTINSLPVVAAMRAPLQRSRMHWSCGSCPLRVDATVVNGVGRVAMFASGARPTSFLDARSGEGLRCHIWQHGFPDRHNPNHQWNAKELLSCIKEGVKIGKLPPKIAAGMEELYHNYKNAVFQSLTPLAEDIVLSNMSVLLDRILLEIEDPFTFPPHHRAIREPFDYYMLGQKYIRPLVDFRRSYIGNIETFQEIEDKLKRGHNIVLVSNHQTEADPAVIALLVEATNPHVAEEMTYVAGDRVVTDPLCKPFSMGRNLLCVYSKKHLYDVPELVEMKKRSNTRTLKEMALLLRTGGQIIWIAPSGGRDRPDIATGRCYPDIFDSSSIDNLRRLVDHSGVPGHLYPLALLCYDIMPPPAKVEKQIGERRDVFFHGVGLSIGQEVHVEKIAAGLDSSEEIKAAFSQALYDYVKEQYRVLESAIYDHKGLHASNSTVSLSQPWE